MLNELRVPLYRLAQQYGGVCFQQIASAASQQFCCITQDKRERDFINNQQQPVQRPVLKVPSKPTPYNS